MPLAAVGFDLDYTLCVPARGRASLLAEAVASAGAPPLETWASRAAYQSAHDQHLTGETREPVFEAMLDDAAVEADPARLARAYRERVNGALEPVPGAAELIRALRRDYRVGLLTNGPRRAQRSKLETLGWTDAFDAVFVTGELPAGKPDGRAFRALLDGLDVAPDELAYVGDDPDADVAGASNAGLGAVQVTYDGGPPPSPRADAHVERSELVSTLPAVLQSL
jgi:putative hydrolase of the HAD superfamily